MPMLQSSTFTSVCPDQTCAVAQRLAPLLRPGDTLLLAGDIGAGKTHFARCLIQSLLVAPEDVPSPTYTLVQSYPSREGEIWHADLYRLTDTNEVFELGLVDAFDSAICLIEWPDRLGDLTPKNALCLTLSTRADPNTRLLTFEWQDSAWSARVKDALNA